MATWLYSRGKASKFTRVQSLTLKILTSVYRFRCGLYFSRKIFSHSIYQMEQYSTRTYEIATWRTENNFKFKFLNIVEPWDNTKPEVNFQYDTSNEIHLNKHIINPTPRTPTASWRLWNHLGKFNVQQKGITFRGYLLYLHHGNVKLPSRNLSYLGVKGALTWGSRTQNNPRKENKTYPPSGHRIIWLKTFLFLFSINQFISTVMEQRLLKFKW